jgi:hypothetical protein
MAFFIVAAVKTSNRALKEASYEILEGFYLEEHKSDAKLMGKSCE